jgi:DNA polymerase I-like protein with 3'-5' exonuclease and polymerase domains
MIDVHAALGRVAGGRARMIDRARRMLFETQRSWRGDRATGRDLMEKAVTLNVRAEVDVGIGENWKE